LLLFHWLPSFLPDIFQSLVRVIRFVVQTKLTICSPVVTKSHVTPLKASLCPLDHPDAPAHKFHLLSFSLANLMGSLTLKMKQYVPSKRATSLML
jgi:hypothetical protein